MLLNFLQRRGFYKPSRNKNGRCTSTHGWWLWCQPKPELKPEPKRCHQSCSSRRCCPFGSANIGQHQCHAEARNHQDSRIFRRESEGYCHSTGIYSKDWWMPSIKQLEWYYNFCQLSTLPLRQSRRMAFVYSSPPEAHCSSENLDQDQASFQKRICNHFGWQTHRWRPR